MSLSTSRIASSLGLTLAVMLASAQHAHANILQDAQGNLLIKNFFHAKQYDRTNNEHERNWAQAVLASWRSGYTDTSVGFGMDIYAQWALKLDGGGGSSNMGNFPTRDNGSRSVREYTHAGAAFKARYADTELKIGTVEIRTPALVLDDSRVLHQMFNGILLENKTIPDLTVRLAHLWDGVGRESSNRQEFYVFGFDQSVSSDALNILALDYRLHDNLRSTYDYAQLEDMYRQHWLVLNYTLPVAEQSTLFAEVQHTRSSEDGAALLGDVDSRSVGLRMGAQHGAHRLMFAYQQMHGSTMHPLTFGNGPATSLSNWIMNGGFMWPGETSYQARYDYNFAALGVPGLSLMVRYASGHGIERGASTPKGQEWERNTDLIYTLQSQPLRGLNIHLRNGSIRSDMLGEFNEIRLITSYNIPF